MFKIYLLLTVILGFFARGESTYFRAQLNRETSTPKPATTSDRVPAGYFLVNNVPKVEEGCKIRFECKKKLKNAEIPKPCVKFCAKIIECENGRRTIAAPGQCVELNEAMVMQEYNDCRNDVDAARATNGIMTVALIDFPCQPGYLPDSRGRCREVW